MTLPQAAAPVVSLFLLATTFAPSAAEPAAPAPYSVPWQLRPTAVGTVVRADTAFALSEQPDGTSAWTTASMLVGSWKVTDNFAPLIRLGAVRRAAGDTSGASFVNPAIGGTYSLKLDDHTRLALTSAARCSTSTTRARPVTSCRRRS